MSHVESRVLRSQHGPGTAANGSVLIQVSESRDAQSLSVMVEIARSCLARGDRVVLFLHGDGAYLGDPAQFAPRAAVQGFTAVREGLIELASAGVETWLSIPCSELRSIEPAAGQSVVTFDDLARSLPAFDTVLSY